MRGTILLVLIALSIVQPIGVTANEPLTSISSLTRTPEMLFGSRPVHTELALVTESVITVQLQWCRNGNPDDGATPWHEMSFVENTAGFWRWTADTSFPSTATPGLWYPSFHVVSDAVPEPADTWFLGAALRDAGWPVGLRLIGIQIGNEDGTTPTDDTSWGQIKTLFQ